MRVSDLDINVIIGWYDSRVLKSDHEIDIKDALLDLLDLRKAAREFFAEEDKWRSSENICSLDSKESRNVIKAHRHLRELVMEGE